jgi:hypothetical protein
MSHTPRALMLLALQAAEEGRIYKGYDRSRGVTVGEVVRWIERTGAVWKSGAYGNAYSVIERLTQEGAAERCRSIPRRGRTSTGYRLTALGADEVATMRAAVRALYGVESEQPSDVEPILDRPVDLDPAVSVPTSWPPIDHMHAVADAAGWRYRAGWWFDGDTDAVVAQLGADWHFRAGPGVMLPIADRIDAPQPCDTALWAALVSAGLIPFHYDPQENP